MFFFLSKILGYLLAPVIWIIGLLFASVLSRNTQLQRRLLAITLIITLLFSNSLIAWFFVNVWAIPPVEDTSLKGNYDVGIVLGGNTITFSSDLKRKNYNGNIDRLLQAVALYRKGKIRKILVTGASGDLVYRDFKEGAMMASFLKSIGIPDSNILVDTMAENTHQNAVYVKKLLNNRPDVRLLLITSSLHMRRAHACFEHEGLKTDIYATNPVHTKIRWNFEFLLVPDSSNFLIWNGLIHEMLGYLIYWFTGYI